MTKYVLFYEAAPGFRERVLAHIEAHRALWHDYHVRGEVLMIGPFVDEPAGGAMGIFATRGAAEAFVEEDPFVAHGVVERWTIREWAEALVPDA